MAINDEKTIVAKWRAGVPLSDAWFIFARECERDKFRDAPDQGASLAIKMLMEAELFSKIASGDLIAFGRRASPSPSDGPIQIPAHNFVGRPSKHQTEGDRLEKSGWTYEDIKISDNSFEPVANFSNTSECKSSPKRVRAGGRKDTFSYSAKVLEVLYKNPVNQELSAEILHPEFATEFARQFPRDQYRLDPPKPRTLRDQIARYRQELAKTGKS